MAIREIVFDVGLDGVSPACEQPGGVQGDHNVTEAVFRLSEGFLSAVTAEAARRGGEAVSRFDVYNGAGGLYRSAQSAFPPEGNEVRYRLQHRDTRFGGQVRVWLVISVVGGDGREPELCTFPAVLRLRDRGIEPDREREYRTLASLAEESRRNAAAAESARDGALEAQGKTEDARAALETGSQFIFDGGWAKGRVDIDFAIDDRLSETSENAVENRCITARFREMEETLSQQIIAEIAARTAGFVTSEQLASVEAAQAAALGRLYPVGSVFITFNSEDYSDFLGFSWERTAVGKTLLGVDPEDGELSVAGNIGGEKQHTLTADEMPNHQHAMELTRAGFNDFAVPVSGGEYKLPLSMDIGVNAHWFTQSVRAAAAGGGQPHNNLPPYITVYIWRRIA